MSGQKIPSHNTLQNSLKFTLKSVSKLFNQKRVCSWKDMRYWGTWAVLRWMLAVKNEHFYSSIPFINQLSTGFWAATQLPIAETPWHHILVQLPLGKSFSPKQVTGCQGLYFSVCNTYVQLFNISLGGLDQTERCGSVFLLLWAGSQCLESGQNIWECWLFPQKVSPLHAAKFWSNGESAPISSAIKHVNRSENGVLSEPCLSLSLWRVHLLSLYSSFS